MNMSSHRHFILNGFNELQNLRPVLFLPYSIMFILSLSTNSLLLYVVVSQRSLHSPMYILIAGMAFVDLSIPLVFVPNMLLSFLFDWRGISLNGCLFQMYFIHFIGTFYSTLVVWMALDRYYAICRPLHYNECMAVPKFFKFVIPLLARNVLTVMVVVILAGRLTFCVSNVIDGCFCEHMALVELACGSTTINSLVGLISVFLVIVVDFLFTLTSYIIIFTSLFSYVYYTHCGNYRQSYHRTHCFLVISDQKQSSCIDSSFFSTMYPLFPAFFQHHVPTVPGCFNPIIYGIRTTEIRQQIHKFLIYHFVKTGRLCLETNRNL
ncbi:hypothetical protein Q5P01_009487 [Channa striata]|uniref:G-protein coupled receptors family 1 profile domain-containing protein n=1 Tax=Channa striata TaxID=64152 RepID=A0AA88SPI9_CHASR|nr:hypothetical protein Q5P01_009487 [Channa striata]